MRITILTPLFPPDTGAPAPYTKLLAKKLTAHTVTLIIYGRLPESVPAVKMITLAKHRTKVSLLGKSLQALFTASKESDLILINNGPSSELPALLFSYLSQTPIKLCLSDPLAAQASQRGWYKLIHSLLLKRVHSVIQLPAAEQYLPAEILPFTKPDKAAASRQQHWWAQHLQEIITL
jgi:hypothetical protein